MGSKLVPFFLKKIALLKQFGKSILIPGFNGLHLYDLLSLYIKGIIEGELSYRAAAISFSFFMALFPFALFILNLIPYIPLAHFQEDFLVFVQDSVPPNTYDAIESIIRDILHNSYNGLLSTGFLLSIFLSANGMNAILGGFEGSYHIQIKRKFFRQYFVALGLSVCFSLLLIVTVAAMLISEVFIQQTKLQDIFSEDISIIQNMRMVFISIMILVATSVLFKFGTRQTKKGPFLSFAAIFTTLLVLVTSYGFGIWVVHFSKYNQLYGSIGTLLVVMFYIWINCMILLLGFELNAMLLNLKAQEPKSALT